MRKPGFWKLAAFCISLLFARAGEAHQHIQAGVNTSGQLTFVSGAASGTIYHMLPETKPRYTGYLSLNEQTRSQFPLDYFSFTALSDGSTDDAQPGHAKRGADIWLEITSVAGPAGASFGFWDASWAYTHNTPTKSFATNSPTNQFRFEISEPLEFVEPEDQDPYGHIEERGWTVSAPGDYYIGFTLYDLSTVGPNSGPLHAPSQIYTFHFVAIPEAGTGCLFVLGGGLLFLRRRLSHT